MEKDDFHFFEFLLLTLLTLFSLLLLSAFLFCPDGEALPPGSAALEFQYRLTDVDRQIGPSISLHESNYRLSFAQESLNWGNLSGFINWVDEPLYHRQGSWLIEFRDFYFDDTKLDAAFGDSVLRYSLISEPPFRFSNLADPDIALEGARLRLRSPRWAVDLFGGDLIALRGAFATGVEYLDETVLGIKSRCFLLPGLTIGCQILRSGRSEDQGQTSDPIFRRNDIYSLSAEVEPWTGYRALQGELSFSHYQRREMMGEHEKGWDYALILGPYIQRPQLTFEANFRHIGTNYRPFSRFYYSDQEGFFFSGEYRPWNFLSLFASADRYHNNLEDDPDLAQIDTDHAILGLRLGAPPFPLTSFRYGVTERESHHAHPTETDSRLENYTAEISYAYWGWNPLFRFQRFDYEDRVHRASDYQSDLYFLELRKGFADSSYTWVNGEWNRYEKRSPDSVTDTYTLRLGADYRPLSALGLRGEASYSRSRDELHLTDTERRGILLALSAYLPWRFNLYAEYQYAQVNDRVGVGDRDEHRLYIRTSQRASWGKLPVTRGPLPPRAPPPGYGTIFGVAFDDRNGNGAQEEGERPVPGIRVQLEDGSVATSDEQGKFSFTNVLMGEHMVSLDTKRIPIEYDVPDEVKRKLEVKRRGISRVEFAFSVLGSMGGWVIEDKNGNGKLDEGEEGIANALIAAWAEGRQLFTYTDEEGKFLFEGLRGGTYQLTLDPSSLPEGAEITPKESLTVSLPIGEELSGVNFLVHIKPRPVIKKIFGEPEPILPEEERGDWPK